MTEPADMTEPIFWDFSFPLPFDLGAVFFLGDPCDFTTGVLACKIGDDFEASFVESFGGLWSTLGLDFSDDSGVGCGGVAGGEDGTGDGVRKSIALISLMRGKVRFFSSPGRLILIATTPAFVAMLHSSKLVVNSIIWDGSTPVNCFMTE